MNAPPNHPWRSPMRVGAACAAASAFVACGIATDTVAQGDPGAMAGVVIFPVLAGYLGGYVGFASSAVLGHRRRRLNRSDLMVALVIAGLPLLVILLLLTVIWR